MEQFLRERLTLRREKLEEDIKSSEELISLFKTGNAISEQDITRLRLKLKQSLSNIQNDVDNYIKTNSEDTEVLRICLKQQVKAEDQLIELDLLNSQEIKNTTTVKLPKLELMKFNGDILKWTEFWDRFRANVHSQNLKDSEKLAYLLSLVQEDARDAIQGLAITNSNYQVAVTTLQNRYGNEQKVIDSHYEALNKINRCEYTSEDCRKTLNSIETHLRVLSSLGENIESNFLRSLIIDKFPEKVIYELNLLSANDQTIMSIRSTLDAIVVALE
ncbi:uncharacterized protein LOC134658404 [Cydia amplana]|uniref:uncharacterized protein LOC134658404 n=1 Tax=Cydia amplana TaxID=1869771 RepID=UPI002FE53513